MSGKVKHGHTTRDGKSPEYNSWSGMRTRCMNKNAINYKNYGGRGINICKRWDSFINFLEDMGPKPATYYSIDRIDNDGDYEPSNCKWSTPVEQSDNRRISTGNASGDFRSIYLELTVDGESKSIFEWSKHYNVKVKTIMSRLNRGWSPCNAVRERPRILTKLIDRTDNYIDGILDMCNKSYFCDFPLDDWYTDNCDMRLLEKLCKQNERIL